MRQALHLHRLLLLTFGAGAATAIALVAAVAPAIGAADTPIADQAAPQDRSALVAAPASALGPRAATPRH